jgi:glutamyl-tRNA synthetase
VELRASMEELIEGFDIGHFGSAPTKFDVRDVFPLTGRVLAALPFETVASEVAALGVPAEKGEAFWNVVRENITVKADMAAWWDLFRDGAEALVEDEDRAFVAEAFAMLPPLPYGADTWSSWTAAVKKATGRKGRGLFMPLRKAVTGRSKGPEMAEVLPLLQVAPKL